MKKETTPAPRTWHSGPPPHVGWWNASNARWTGQWRWWDGVQWSDRAGAGYTAEDARAAVLRLDYDGGIEWTDYYPEGARVPRVDPANRWIAPMLPALNAGSMFAWEEAAARMRVTARSKEWARAAEMPTNEQMETLWREPIVMPTPYPDRCVPKIDAATCTSLEMPKVMEVAPTPEEDEAWRSISTGQRRPVNPEPRELAGVNTLALMKELFRRFQE